MAKNRENLGKISSDLLKKQPDTLSPIEQANTQLKDYEKNLLEVAQDGKKKIMGDFFIVVLTKKEKLMQNVIRNYFFFRISCPTPDYDQTVYKYSYSEDKIDFIWTIPSKHTCLTFLENRDKIVPEEWGLLKFILEFRDGTLYKKSKKLNGEKFNSKFVNELETQ